MPRGKGQRKLVRVVAGSALGFILLLVFLPLWFPWLLRPLAHRQGLHYSSYTRLGYGHFALHQIGFTNQTTRIYAARLEGFVPTTWLWHLATRNLNDQAPYLVINQWQFDSLPSPAPAQKPSGSPYDQAQQLTETLKALQRWLPTAFLSNGTVRIDKSSVAVPSLSWSRGTLQALAGVALNGQQISLAAALSPAQPFTLRVHSEALHLDSAVYFFTNAYGLDLQSTNFWWSNRVELLAHFTPNGLLPETATLTAHDFTLPRQVAAIPNYREITGSLAGNWQAGRFGVELSARAQPVIGQTNLPPVDAMLRLQGDTNAANVQTFDISSPAFSAKLSNPVAVHISGSGPLLRQPVGLIVRADLAKQPWLPLTGVLTGIAEFRPAATRVPQAHFRLTGSGVGTEAIKTRTFTLDALCNWPLVDITTARASFDDGSEASLTGKADLEKDTVSDGALRFSGPLARQWLPQGCSYESLLLSATFAGSFKQLSHAGHVRVTHLSTPNLQPLGLQMDWKGRQDEIESFELNLSTTNSSLLARGALALTNRQPDLRLASLSFSTHHRPLLELKEPCHISAQRVASGRQWRLSLTPFEWQGPGGQVACSAAIDWPESGSLRLSLSNLSSTNFVELVKTVGPETDIRTLQLTAAWTNGPLNFLLEGSTVGRAAILPETQLHNPAAKPKSRPEDTARGRPIWESLLAGSVSAELNVAGDRTGVTLSNLVVKTQGTEVVAVHGFVPVTFYPAAASANFLEFEAQQPLHLNAVVQSQAAIWDQLTDWTGVTLDQPDLNLNLSGTWQDLRGQIAFQAKAITLEEQPATMPSVENLRFQVELDRQQAQLTKGDLLVQGQPVSLTGQIPLGESFWRGLKRKQLPDWQQATARLRISRAKLAAFEPLFPELLAPQGQLDVDLTLARGAKLSGSVNIQNARTRPLSDLGPIRDINVSLRCRDRFLELQNASAKLGGAPVALSGAVDFSGTDWLRGRLPPFQISVNGNDVPLSRQPESIIRSDLLLGITKTNGAPPLISGVAHLRDSFYLSDLSALVPGKVASPDSRPPYFSIEDPLLADWRLAVSVDGARFIKVRSTVFNGEVSANLTLQGTLKDPIALGDLKIDSGIVRFPFANLQVQQGLVNLTSQNPYHPQLQVSAISKQFGYDIHMEVSGTADAPIIQFTSNPPLSSEQIVLLITAGQMPQGAYTLTPQQRAQTVALFLGSDLLSKLGFGDQTEQRLTIRSGEQISTQGKPTYNVEFKLTHRWAVTAEYDRFGDYNAGVKWRIYSK